jgi:hypothetical protein
MVLDRLAQSSARPVQPNAKGIAVQPHIGGHDFPVLFTEIDPPDQFGINGTKLGKQPARTSAGPRHLHRRIGNQLMWVSCDSYGQAAAPSGFAKMIVHGGPEDRV